VKYRKMGSLNWEVSALGFGVMRLPTEMKDEKPAIIEAEAIKMIRYAIDNGVNYIDTAWGYHAGESEILVGKALQDGYREKVKLVTKLPTWLIKKQEDFDEHLNKQLEKLQTDHLDIYLFHSTNKAHFKIVKDLNLIEKMEQAKKDGKIKHIGFSFHDNYETYKEIIDYYNWDASQIQYNYVDYKENQATIKGLKYAAGKGIAVIVMEPILGGKLANSKGKMAEIIKNAPIQRTGADWALHFIWNHPEVSVVLSGMSTMQHVEENIISAENSGINSLSPEELETIEKLHQAAKNLIIVPCTSCGYCMPCPEGVYINGIFSYALNELAWGVDLEKARAIYDAQLVKTPEKLNEQRTNGAASLCIQCGQCLEKCPQEIDIPTELEKVKAVFEDNKPLNEVF
jgi:uncharacterized protein